MTLEEFSTQFDVLWNNISSNKAPGLNDYEKSVFLTKAQDEFIKTHYSGNNKLGTGYDSSAKRQIDFSALIVNAESPENPVTLQKFDHRSHLFELPDDILIMISEQLEVRDTDRSVVADGVKQIIPLAYDEYLRLMSKPFKEPLKRQAWRLNTKSKDGDKVAEVLVNTSTERLKGTNGSFYYICRYVRKPAPIVLSDISDYGVTIGGKKGKSECELDSSTHEEILQRAIELAKITWAGDTESVINSGTRSE